MRKYRLNFFSLVLVIVTITGFDAYLFTALNQNFGILYPRFTFIYLFLLPGFIIINFAIQKYSFKLPHLLYFLIFTLVYYLNENNRGDYYIPDYDLINRTSPLYFAFISMINFNNSFTEYKKILKVVLLIIISTTTLFYFGFLGFIDFGQINYQGRVFSQWNLNKVADTNILGIFITYILYHYDGKIKFFNIKISPLFLSFYLLIIIYFTSTRGSLLLLIFGIVYYLRVKISFFKFHIKFLTFLIVLLIILIFVFGNYLETLTQNIFVFDRVINSDYEAEGRFMQIIASWENFKSNIWFGVGYNDAAASFYEGITRSNFQYTQILAAGGLVLFTTFFIFIFKMFFGALKNRSNFIIISMFSFIIILFIFRRIEMYHAIIAFIVYSESRFMKIQQ
jgi:hypothetical protein